MIDIDTRLRVGRSIGKTEREASGEVFRTLKRARGHPEKPPPTVSDGWGGIRKAMVEVYGKVPAYEGRGRPSEKKRPLGDWKIPASRQGAGRERSGNGNENEVVFGEEEEVLELFEDHTAYVELTHLTNDATDEQSTGPEGPGLLKKLSMHWAAASWDDAIHNLTWLNKSLRIDLTGPLNGRPGRRAAQRTPSMAAGLTDQAWSVRKLLRTVPTTNT